MYMTKLLTHELTQYLSDNYPQGTLSSTSTDKKAMIRFVLSDFKNGRYTSKTPILANWDDLFWFLSAHRSFVEGEMDAGRVTQLLRSDYTFQKKTYELRWNSSNNIGLIIATTNKWYLNKFEQSIQIRHETHIAPTNRPNMIQEQHHEWRGDINGMRPIYPGFHYARSCGLLEGGLLGAEGSGLVEARGFHGKVGSIGPVQQQATGRSSHPPHHPVQLHYQPVEHHYPHVVAASGTHRYFPDGIPGVLLRRGHCRSRFFS